MTYFKTCRLLPEDAAYIRKRVFVEEQGVSDEFDDTDTIAAHIVLYNEENKPIATCRYFWDGKYKAYIVGRIAVLKEFRKKHFGAALLREAERQIQNLGADRLLLAAQIQARSFYEKQGYTPTGDEYLEERCLHVWMCKKLTVQE